MITKVRVKNFKCFGESGGDFELAPLTFLFGDNSAGKSTVLQALDFCLAGSQRSVSDGLAGLAKESSISSADFRKRVFCKDMQRVMEVEVSCSFADGTSETVGATIRDNSGSVERIETGNWNRVRALQRFVHADAQRLGDDPKGPSSLSRMNPVPPHIVNAMLTRFDVGYTFTDESELHDHFFDIDLPFHHVGTGIHHLVDNLQRLGELAEHVTLALEEPESHLHPRQLGPFTRIIAERVAAEKGSQVIVECHSDLMLFQLMNLVASGDVRCPEDIRIYYIRRQEGGSVLYPVTIRQNGDVDGWPGKLFPWRSELLSEVFR